MKRGLACARKPLFPETWDIKKEDIKVDTAIDSGRVKLTIDLSNKPHFPEEIRKGAEKIFLLAMNERIFKEGLISEEVYSKARVDIDKLYA